jgi:Rgg/GadR/MutR family transcriptional activator
LVIENESIGNVLREIREGRGLKLKDLVSADVTSSTIGKFERGETSISIDRLLKILPKMNMTIEEFFNSLNSYKESDIKRKMKLIHKYYNEQNVEMIQQILDEEERRTGGSEVYRRLNVIMIKNIIRLLNEDKGLISEDDVLFLSGYLLSIEAWTGYELTIFINCNSLLSTTTINTLGREMLQRSIFYQEIEHNSAMIKAALINIYDNMIDRREKQAAFYFGRRLEKMVEVRDIFEKAHYLFLKAYYDWRFSNDAYAFERMENIIKSLKNLDSMGIAINLSRKLKHIRLDK